jgi:PST family polysaccharide transporter
VQCAIEVLALTALARWRPPLRWSGQALRDLTPVSMNYLGFSVFNYVVRNLDNLLIGRYAGAQSLGLYSRAYGLMLLPATHLSRVLSRVMFPSLARLQQDHARARAVYLRAQQTIALISFPLSIGLLVTAEEFVQVLYGEPWRDTAPILRVLSMVGLMQSIGSTTGWIYQSQGRTDVMLRWSLLSALPTIPAFLVGIRWGAFGVAVAYLVRGLLLVYPNHAVPGKLIGLHFTDTVRALGGVLFCAVLMGLGAWAAGVYWKPTSAGGMLATRTTCGVLLYVGALFALRPTGFLVALNWLRARTTMES